MRALSRSAVGRRLVKGSLANFADKLAVLIVQLIAIPLLSHNWGADGYGTWLMVMTIPTYIALSDFGLWTAAGVEITQKVARSDTDGALQTFQTAWVLVSATLGVLVIAAATYTVSVTSGALPGEAELAVVTLIVALYGAAMVQMSTLAVVFRATHKLAHAALISTAVTSAEGFALIVTVSLGADLLSVAAILLAVRSVGCAIAYVSLRRREPWLRLGAGRADLEVLRRLAPTSVAAFSLAIANGISLQGTVLVIGWVAGPAAAAVFGAARFLARIPLQFSGLVVRTSIPELTRARASSDRALQSRLIKVNMLSALVPTLPWIPILILSGPVLLETMSGRQLSADWWLFGTLAATTALGSLWQALASPMIAANQQSRFAYAYAALSAVAVTMVLLPGTTAIVAASSALLVAELAMTILVYRLNAGIEYGE